MKLTKTLRRATNSHSFFRLIGSEYVMCAEFTEELAGTPITDQLSARYELRTKNPKTKGFRKVLRKGNVWVEMNKQEFPIVVRQMCLLDTWNINVGDCFWMKAELS